MKPYYQHDNFTLYNGDCLEVIKDFIKDGVKVDMVLTDPPYAINITGKETTGGNNLCNHTIYKITSEWDKVLPKKEVFDAIFQISYRQIIFGGNYFTHLLPQSKKWLVWDKRRPLGTTFSEVELIYTNGLNDNRQQIYRFTWNGMLQENMKNKEQRIHPTQKPVELLSAIINDHTEQNDTILDCFLGSGTTAVACARTDRKCIGIELEEEYCGIAVKRYEQEIKQSRLL